MGPSPPRPSPPPQGEVYTPRLWLERQDELKKLVSQEDLADFYNITLERPRADPKGYDTLFIEAASVSSLVSRISHCCSPNCHVVTRVHKTKIRLGARRSLPPPPRPAPPRPPFCPARSFAPLRDVHHAARREG